MSDKFKVGDIVIMIGGNYGITTKGSLGIIVNPGTDFSQIKFIILTSKHDPEAEGPFIISNDFVRPITSLEKAMYGVSDVG